MYETSCDTQNDVIVRDIVCIWNLRVILAQLVGGIRTLAMYGPMKQPDKDGLDEVSVRLFDAFGIMIVFFTFVFSLRLMNADDN